MTLIPTTYQSFATPEPLSDWLSDNHASKTELWVQIYKKQSGTPSIDWQELVIECLKWGWIDGHKKSLDEASFLQRITPRKAKSNWSKKNCDYVDALVVEGLMQPSGMVHVEAAKADGRWDQAYSGAKDMVIPQDFLTLLDQQPEAKAFYGTLNRTNLYAIYHRLHTAKKPETRANRMEAIIAKLGRGEKFH